ncbi:hypothetical protein [Xanthomonas oryzae]|uniref:Putative membrane protein n=1 Tax=Xanthomonas oryzae pv. oryzae (strain PXO99A) TaxID=360094 RepID=A0A0J9WXW3_XANOP|nr:hypothetical protein [Xanthomonas oryzae]ACD60560.1 putative membrane protein [Xanthomonas oryzae pv. oryzae PXO99A]ACD60571.1 hypothetical protein PXO_05722 [Xanthomonas oryzae pv. oryzae PXO99A]
MAVGVRGFAERVLRSSDIISDHSRAMAQVSAQYRMPQGSMS